MGVNDIKPPKEIEGRRARVHVLLENTLEIPFDPRDPDINRWFDQSSGMRKLTSGNKVSGFVTGAEAFANMADAIETADAFDHYIYMMNWHVDLDVELKPARRLGDMLLNAEKKLVQIRGLFWDQVLLQNSKHVDRLNDVNVFSRGAAILDNNTINNFPAIPAGLRVLIPVGGPLLAIHFFVSRFLPGSHHQKALIVKGREGLIAFVGGVDFNDDRIKTVSRQSGSPMHDVHCRIEGPAAREVLQVFLDRWQDHPDSKTLKAKGAADLRGLTEPVPGTKGDQHVQIGCTFGNGKQHSGIKNVNGGNFYSFAPDGERSAERLIRHAIGKAQRFIYMEDQYLVGIGAAISLNVALADPKLERVVILIPHSSISDHPHVWKMRKDFIRVLFNGLSEDQKKKVTICYRKRFGDAPNPKKIDDNIPESYIHAKMMIVDDKFAMIGSANSGLRSYSNDSEIVAGVFDESQNKPGVIHFAHDLRIKLWAKHLALSRREVFDPIASSVHWRSPSNASGVGVYDPDADTDAVFSLINRFASEAQAEPYGGVGGKELTP